MSISIVVPVYKVEAFIERFINSILNQTNKLFEVILVDDKSPDNSTSMAKQMLSNSTIDYKIVYRERNGGLSAARNSGIAEAKGDYIYFADSDDELELDAVAQFHKAASEYSDVDIFVFNARFKNPEDIAFKEWQNRENEKEIIAPTEFLTILYNGGTGAYIWKYLFKKRLFEKVKFKEGSVWEDSVILPQLIVRSKKIVSYYKSFIYKYWIREGSISQSVHPFIDAVVPALNEVEELLYPTKKENLYDDFVLFRTTLTMRLSRECFVRSKDFKRLMQVHKSWGRAISSANIVSLKSNGRGRSAVFLKLIKYFPAGLYLLYRIKLLK